MTESENQAQVPAQKAGYGGCKTQYKERKNFEDAAKANYIPPKEKFKPNERVSHLDIEKIDKARTKSRPQTTQEP